jgi:uncharacterized protein (DUF697 family)
MKGYRTILGNVLMLLASFGAIYGFEVTEEQLEQITTGIVTIFTVGNLILRVFTNTPVGEEKQPDA